MHILLVCGEKTGCTLKHALLGHFVARLTAHATFASDGPVKTIFARAVEAYTAGRHLRLSDEDCCSWVERFGITPPPGSFSNEQRSRTPRDEQPGPAEHVVSPYFRRLEKYVPYRGSDPGPIMDIKMMKEIVSIKTRERKATWDSSDGRTVLMCCKAMSCIGVYPVDINTMLPQATALRKIDRGPEYWPIVLTPEEKESLGVLVQHIYRTMGNWQSVAMRQENGQRAVPQQTGDSAMSLQQQKMNLLPFQTSCQAYSVSWITANLLHGRTGYCSKERSFTWNDTMSYVKTS